MPYRFSKYPAHYIFFILFLIALLNGFYTDLVYTDLVTAWAYDLFQFLLLPVALLALLYKYHDIKPANYGISIPKSSPGRKGLILAVLYSSVLLNAIYYSAYFLSKPFFSEIDQQVYIQLVPDGIFHIPVVIYLAATAAIFEEITYRGIPFLITSQYHSHRYYIAIYIISTSVLFSSIHWESGAPYLIAAFAYGVFSAMFYLHYRNLIPVIAAHFTGDMISFW